MSLRIPPVVTYVMTRPDLLGYILSWVDEDAIGWFMNIASLCVANNQKTKSQKPIDTIRTISWIWRSAFDQFARKPINDLTFKLYASNRCTLLGRGNRGYTVSLLDSVTRYVSLSIP